MAVLRLHSFFLSLQRPRGFSLHIIYKGSYVYNFHYIRFYFWRIDNQHGTNTPILPHILQALTTSGMEIHPVFHVSLLKGWRTASLQEDQPVPADDVPDVEDPYYEIERILRWRKVKKNKKILK